MCEPKDIFTIASKHRILVVEDESQTREFVCRILSDHDFEIASASDGFRAVKIAKDFVPHIVLLDVTLRRGQDGIEICRQIQNIVPSAAVIMLTGAADPNTVQAALDAGAVDYISKPFKAPHLVARIMNNLMPPLPGKILIADDDPTVREVVRKMLETAGLNVTEADCRDTIIAAAGECSIVLLDVQFPSGPTGIDICRELRELHTTMRIAMLTGYADREMVRQAVEAGADDYILKPISPRTLLTKIRQLVVKPVRTVQQTTDEDGDLEPASLIRHGTGLASILAATIDESEELTPTDK